MIIVTGYWRHLSTMNYYFKRPKSIWIKLDALGSCVWYELEHSHDIQTISAAVHEQFGDEAEPLLPRLGQFINLLERYGFIQRQV